MSKFVFLFISGWMICATELAVAASSVRYNGNIEAFVLLEKNYGPFFIEAILEIENSSNAPLRVDYDEAEYGLSSHCSVSAVAAVGNKRIRVTDRHGNVVYSTSKMIHAFMSRYLTSQVSRDECNALAQDLEPQIFEFSIHTINTGEPEDTFWHAFKLQSGSSPAYLQFTTVPRNQSVKAMFDPRTGTLKGLSAIIWETSINSAIYAYVPGPNGPLARVTDVFSYLLK